MDTNNILTETDYAVKNEEPMDKNTAALLQGRAPDDTDLLDRLTVGLPFLTDFWDEKYLKEYICRGGSKIKFITGRSGSGKSHLMKQMAAMARKDNYLTAEFSARDIWLHDFREIYAEIFRQCDLMRCLEKCADQVIRNCGFSPENVPEGFTFMDYLSQENLADALTRREIRLQLKQMFLDDPLIDNNFALACSLLTGGILGHPLLEEQNKNLLLGWLGTDTSVKITSLRPLGLSPARITKLNARHMLRSLAQVIHKGGYSGLIVAIDDMEILIGKSSLNPLHYTKMRREDTYESIRQLIDDIDSLKNIMFLFGFGRELLDNESSGIKSYQALWMRIQNEIISQRFNRFADIVDMDRLGDQLYTPPVIMKMSENFSQAANALGISAHPIDMKTAETIRGKSVTGNISIPRLTCYAAMKVETDV
ncbi:MAG: ATP-binding protein [Clostridiales bacterium]|nr:ATP-binding protein [Clostridiales bacterium]